MSPPASTRSGSPTPAESDAAQDDTASLLHGYFALSRSLGTLYTQWSASDANFARRASSFTGIRILNQDAWEALVMFICSSNNNIARIGQMAHKLCLHYGPYLGTVHGETFHDFPPPEALAGDQVEAHLRELGFGYRAKYIAETARIVARERPAQWLLRLRNPECPALGVGDAEQKSVAAAAARDAGDVPTYRAAHEALLELTGVGPKVADCVCLMGLGWYQAIPVDTHIWQIAQRDYKFGKGAGKTKTFSKVMYDAVGDHFRTIWGDHAGWAQSVLFTANLRSFAEQASGVKAEAEERETKVKIEEIEETVVSGSRSRTRKRKVAEIEIPLKVEKVEKSEDAEGQVDGLNTAKRRVSKRVSAARKG